MGGTPKTALHRLFKNYQPLILGDREFCSVKLADWLRKRSVQFGLRLRKDEFVEVEKDVWRDLKALGLKPGLSLFLQGVKVTKTHKICGFNIACKWKRKFHGWSPEEGWFILTNLTRLQDAILTYKKRFNIEEMFRDFKSGGYNLEDTNLSGYRLISLILIVAIAYS
ncbi:transposase, partial [Moorena sp. SIO3I6]|uniref:transposase n=1 Tax=Moorena sp. SIO3I6 TaxID=2607831 RepID=UPI0025D81CF5